jgi:hypothetical protein
MGYDGAFVARIDGDEKGQLTALIPQVFQGSHVLLDMWAGGRPAFGEQGYVVFINGDPTWPVWIGTQYLSHQLPSPSSNGSSHGGGPGSPEVWVGPHEPPDDSYTMWFDSDEPNPAEDPPLWVRGPAGADGAPSTVAGPPGDPVVVDASWNPITGTVPAGTRVGARILRRI